MHHLRPWRRLSAAIVIATSLLGLHSVGVSAQTPPQKLMPGVVPDLVKHGDARLVGHHSGSATIDIAVALPIRDPAALQQFLRNVTDPASPSYHHYLSLDQANQLFNPTPAQEQQVISWLQAGGLTVTGTYPNHLLVDARGTVGQVESLFHVTLNDYQAVVRGRNTTFFAPSGAAAVDGSVANVVQSVVGLDSVPRFYHSFTNGSAHNVTPYYPQDFANAYDLGPLWNAGYTGAGQHIGIVMWTVPPSNVALQNFDATTGAHAPTQGSGLNVIPVDGGTTSQASPDTGEAGMDIEYSSGMAPGATIDYYEAPTDSQGNPTDKGLEDALELAATDGNNNLQISNSWGGCEASSASDPWTQAVESIFAANSATGHNYFFATGDSGSWCQTNSNGTGRDPYPNYPASSPNVTAVGATRFNSTINGSYPGESAWQYCANCGGSPEGSGGGYSNIFARPYWQTASTLAANGARGYPDVSAVGDPATGALVDYGSGGSGQFGGTSLSTPLWAGMSAVLNQYLTAQGQGPLGPLDPVIANLGNLAELYPPFHDITAGTNGAYTAGSGWDAVTGYGTPDLWNLARDVAGPIQAASYNTSAAPTGFVPGGTATYAVTLTNSGAGTWASGGAHPVDLGIHFASKGGGFPTSYTAGWLSDQRFSLPADVAPGQSVTLTVSVRAPSTPGPYVLEYQMVQEGMGWFQQYKDVSVSVASMQATIQASTAPQSFTPGATSSFQVTVTNSGAVTLPAGGSNPVHLGIHFASRGGGFGPSGTGVGSGWLTDQRFSLPADLTAGGSVTLTVSVTAPATFGNYVLEYQLVQEGVAWVPQYLDNSVTLSQLVASYSPMGQPTTFASGAAGTYSVAVKNTGTTTWPSGGSHPVALGIHFSTRGGGYPASGAGWLTDQRFSLPADVPPGATATLTVLVSAPGTVGNLVLEYQMVDEGVAWFPQYMDSAVSVTALGLGASYSVSGQPSSFTHGTAATYSVTVTNTGTTPWPAGGLTPVDLGIHFGPKGGGFPTSYSGWLTDQRFALPGSGLLPGQSATLSVTVQAPASAGSYVLEYQMVQEGIAWFPQYLDSPVSVT